MKFKQIQNWTNKANTIGLLFFAQVLDEALFDYTLDSYKPMAMNPRLLCIECLSTIEYVKKGLIKHQNLKHIIEELKWSLQTDYAAKKIVKKRITQFEKQINTCENDYNSLSHTIKLLYRHFDNKKYLNYIIDELTKKVIDGKEKENIYKLTKTFITELINYGYHTNYIYYQTQSFFFGTQTISNTSQINEYFKIFNFEEHEYRCIFKCSRLFLEFKESVNKLNISFSEKIEPASKMQHEKDFYDSVNPNEVFIICDNILAHDSNNAKIIAETKINKIANLFSFFHHKERPKLYDNAIVQRIEDNYVVQLGPQNKSIIKKEDIKPETAAVYLKKILNNLKLDPETIYQFGRAIDLHSTTLESSEIENQLLNFWTAIETLFPKNEDSKIDRIVQISDSITPFLINDYIRRIVMEFMKDLKLYNVELYEEMSNKIITVSTENTFHKFNALLSTKENDQNRSYLLSSLEDFPLLKYRLYSVHKILSNPEEIKKLLKTHKSKVEWQIRRIYRTRNLIVHAGKVPSYTNILVENIHNYLDTFLQTMLYLSINTKFISSISQAVLETRFRLNSFWENLENNIEEEMSIHNFKSILYDIQK